MKKALGIVSTNYHLLVFLFLKETVLKEYGQIDLAVTDKTPYMEELFYKGAFAPYFTNVYFTDGRKIKNPYKNGFVTLYESFVHNKTTREILTKQTLDRQVASQQAPKKQGQEERMQSARGADSTWKQTQSVYMEENAGQKAQRISDEEQANLRLLKEFPCRLDTYDDVFFASPGMPDEIVKELGKTLIMQNKKVRFHRYEDGFASYTKKPEHLVSTPLGRKLYRLIFRFDTEAQEDDLYLFEPYLAEKDIDFVKKKIEKSKKEIDAVIDSARRILKFESHPFPEKYVFLGQGTDNVTQNPATYQRLPLRIKDAVGYENMVIKPHPRGKYDDFGGQIKVFKDSCPFELAVANGDMEGKTLLSYYSTACVSAKLLFGSSCRIIFLNKMAGDSFNEKCDYDDYFKKVTETFEEVYVPADEDELFRIL